MAGFQFHEHRQQSAGSRRRRTGALPLLLLLPLLPPLSGACLVPEARAAGPSGSGEALRLGIVLDSPGDRVHPEFDRFLRVIREFFGDDPRVVIRAEDIRAGDGTPAGVRSALGAALADPGIDVVLADGGIGSSQAARLARPPRPVIAGYVVDAALQGLPRSGEGSGVLNLTYINTSWSAGPTLRAFHDVVSFRRLAVVLWPGVIEEMAGFLERVRGEMRAAGAEIDLVPAKGGAGEILAALPPKTDAVYLTPIPGLTEAGLDSLVAGAIARKLPTFSFLGRSEVERGILGAYVPGDEVEGRARRVAVILDRFLAGEDLAELPVDLTLPSRLVVNEATAAAIGVDLNLSALAGAELVGGSVSGPGPSLTLAAAVAEVVEADLDLSAARLEVLSGADEVRKARADLLPQVGASYTATAIRKEAAEASFGLQAERERKGSIGFSQVLYDDRTLAAYQIERHVQRAREEDFRGARLDRALEAAAGYIDLLRAQALQRIQSSNLALTESNLNLARTRESVGAGGRADVYRWESQAATARQNVSSAGANVEIARIALNRLRNRPLEEPFATVDTRADDPTLVTGDARLRRRFETTREFRLLRDFLAEEAVARSPEIRAIDAAIRARERARSAASRSFWLPALSLEGGIEKTFDRSGAGAGGLAFPPSSGLALPKPEDLTWQVRLEASLPVFAGLGRVAAHSQARTDLERLRTERRSAEEALSRSVRSALHRAGASWIGIGHSRAAAGAAKRNLDLVVDAYTRGAVSIITLLDAQNAALVADQGAANAVYDFLLDWMRVERAAGEFDFFRTPEERARFFERLEAHDAARR